MCKTGNKLVLCSCLTDNVTTIGEARKILKESLKNLSQDRDLMTWTLYKFVGHEDSGILGSLIMPVDALNQKLTNKYVLSQINARNCFDFEYTANEGDNLQIEHENSRYKHFLSFIYRKGEWKADSYYTFTEKIKALNIGTVNVKPATFK